MSRLHFPQPFEGILMKKLMMRAFIFATIFALGAFIANVAMYILVTLEILELGIDIVTVLFIGILAAPIGLVFGFWPLALEETESPLYRKYRIKKMNMAFRVIQIPYYCFLLYRASPLMHGGLLESMILMSVIIFCVSIVAYLWYRKHILVPIQLSAGTDQDSGKHNPTLGVAVFFIVFAFMFGAISEKDSNTPGGIMFTTILVSSCR